MKKTTTLSKTTLTNEQLLESKPAIEQLMNQKRIPVRLAYDLQKRLDGVEQALETYTKTRDNLIKQYGKPSPMGGFQIDPKNETGTAAFVKEHDELLGHRSGDRVRTDQTERA